MSGASQFPKAHTGCVPVLSLEQWQTMRVDYEQTFEDGERHQARHCEHCHSSLVLVVEHGRDESEDAA